MDVQPHIDNSCRFQAATTATMKSFAGGGLAHAAFRRLD
jgi:hypothetical protein